MNITQSSLWGFKQIDTEFDKSGQATGGFFVPEYLLAEFLSDLKKIWLADNFPTLANYLK